LRRLIIFGIDGGAFNTFSPWLKEKRLPHLARLLAQGTGGYLESTIPPVTLPAWPSMATGLLPGGHGNCSFDAFAPGDKKRRFSQTGSGDLGRPALWDLVGAAGGSSVVVNVPGTYPARALRGAMVTGMFTPSAEAACIYPERLRAPLAERLGGAPWQTWKFSGRTSAAGIQREIRRVERSKFDTVDFLAEAVPNWKLLWVVFQGGDALQHLLKGRRDDLLRGYFAELDGYLGWALDRLDPEDHLLVVSDHGFAAMRYEFVIAHWLKKEGFMVFKPDIGEPDFGKKGMLSRIVRRGGRLFHPSRSTVCWEQSRAFPCGYGIRLSVKNREPGGILEPGTEAAEVKREIIARLKAMENPFTGKPACSLVAGREELYSGPYLDRVPDILLRFRGDSTMISMKRRKGPWNRLGKKPWHHPDGILLLSGPGVHSESRAPSFRARVVDVAPTALCLMGMKVPGGLDGRVLEERLNQEFLRENPVLYSAPLHVSPLSPAAFTGEEQCEIEARLKSLGYL